MRSAGWLGIALFALLATGCSHGTPAVSAPAPDSPALPPQAAPSRVDAPLRTVVCLLEGDERRLEIFEREGGCFLRYNRRGNVREAASSKRGTEHCRKIMDRIQSNLTAGGFQCGS